MDSNKKCLQQKMLVVAHVQGMPFKVRYLFADNLYPYFLGKIGILRGKYWFFKKDYICIENHTLSSLWMELSLIPTPTAVAVAVGVVINLNKKIK